MRPLPYGTQTTKAIKQLADDLYNSDEAETRPFGHLDDDDKKRYEAMAINLYFRDYRKQDAA